MSRTRRNSLPILTNRFLRSETGAEADIIVHKFHAWMNSRGHELSMIEPEQVNKFLRCPKRRANAKAMGYDYRKMLGIYLDYMYVKGKISFDSQQLRAACGRRLPESAEKYLEEASTTRKPGTIKCYRTNINHFHRWLERQSSPTLRGLKRHHLVEWLKELHTKGLHPATRRAIIIDVRTYLWWLKETGYIRRAPDELILKRDLPKLPSYLPRPLPPEVDRVLLERLSASEGIYDQGLLLMRFTGQRIGELMNLSFDCMRADEIGHTYLKVPLGKLNNERLVPLHDEAKAVITRLQAYGDQNREYLIPRGSKNRPVIYNRFKNALKEACEGLNTAEPITSHRLRHTYATTLLNAGMSLVGVMRLLGHRDTRMTMRYAEITSGTMEAEYFEALEKLEDIYQQPQKTTPVETNLLLDELIQNLKRDLGAKAGQSRRKLSLLIRRIERLNDDLRPFISEKQD